MDKQRIAYYNFYTKQKYGDTENYDICLDSDSLGIDKCIDSIYSSKDMKKQENIKTINKLKIKLIETAKKSQYFEIVNSFYGIGEVLMFMGQYLKEEINMQLRMLYSMCKNNKRFLEK